MEGFALASFGKIGVNFFIFIIGLVVGSFLNVCIYRLPREESIVKPRSHCPHCRKTIPWYDNIPLLSYILLKGKCRFCKARISFQYFTVELVTALLFILFYNTFGLTLKSLIYVIFTCGLVVATFVDFNFRIIPDEINIGGIILGLAISFIYPELQSTNNHFFGLYQSFFGYNNRRRSSLDYRSNRRFYIQERDDGRRRCKVIGDGGRVFGMEDSGSDILYFADIRRYSRYYN